MEQLPSAAIAAMAANARRLPERPPFECIALLLQGGGALGSYQAGVYAALAQADLQPDWVAGISIGAINGALIAGNVPERRVEQLKKFWEQVTAPPHGIRGLARAAVTVQRCPSCLVEPDECCLGAVWGRAWIFHAAPDGAMVRSAR